MSAIGMYAALCLSLMPFMEERPSTVTAVLWIGTLIADASTQAIRARAKP